MMLSVASGFAQSYGNHTTGRFTNLNGYLFANGTSNITASTDTIGIDTLRAYNELYVRDSTLLQIILANSGSPGGSSGELQWNNAGSFDGASILNYTTNSGGGFPGLGIGTSPDGLAIVTVLNDASYAYNLRLNSSGGSEAIIAFNGTQDQIRSSGAQMDIVSDSYLDLIADSTRILGNATVNGNGYIRWPRGTTAQRPSTPIGGEARYNTDSSKFEGYEDGEWKNFITGLATINQNEVPYGDASGNLISSSSLIFNPGTGFLTTTNLAAAAASDQIRILSSGTDGIQNGVGINAFNQGSSSENFSIRAGTGSTYDSGTEPIIKIGAYRTDGGGSIVNRPILSEYNGTTKQMEVSADGTRDYQDNDLINIGSINADIGSFTTLDASGDVAFDTDGFFFDQSSGYVGVGTTTPGQNLVGTYDYPASVNVVEVRGNLLSRISVKGDAGGGAVDLIDASAPSNEKWVQINNSGGITEFRLFADTGSELIGDIITIDNTNGNVGVNTNSPSAKFHTLATTEQLRLGYDASNYISTTVASDGGVTFNSVGSGTDFTFSDPVIVSGDITADNIELVTEISLSSSQILNCNTSPVELISAPGSGNAIVVHQAVCKLTYGTTTYATGSIGVYYGTSLSSATLSDFDFPIESTASAMFRNNGLNSANSGNELHMNESIVFYQPASDPTTGDGTAKIKIWYTIESL